jgi:hypothetical protein
MRYQHNDNSWVVALSWISKGQAVLLLPGIVADALGSH